MIRQESFQTVRHGWAGGENEPGKYFMKYIKGLLFAFPSTYSLQKREEIICFSLSLYFSMSVSNTWMDWGFDPKPQTAHEDFWMLGLKSCLPSIEITWERLRVYLQGIKRERGSDHDGILVLRDEREVGVSQYIFRFSIAIKIYNNM